MKKRLLSFPTTLQFNVLFEKVEDLKKARELTKRQSSAIRAVYLSQKEICRYVKETYNLPYLHISCAKRALPKDKKAIFGGKKPFEKLKKKHLQGKRREELKREWMERRQVNLISLGSEAKEHRGNPCIRLEDKEGVLYLRIAIGEREFVYAKVKRKPSNEKDKWLTFLSMLYESLKTQGWFSYTVELKLKGGEVYGYVGFDYPLPELKTTKRYGVMAIDTNASHLHIALAELSEDGSLRSFRRISLHNFWQYPASRREDEEWLMTHKAVDFAYSKGKAIAMEDLKSVRNGCREDGKVKLRKRLHRWKFKRLLQKVERVARDRGIEAIKAHSAYTFIIGMLKCAPQLGIDKDVAGAYVIDRRALGFKEDTPKNYEKLLKNKGFLQSALGIYRQEEQRLSGPLEKETNEYKRNAIKSELKEVHIAIKSLQIEPITSSGPMEGSSWSVLKVALLAPVLGKTFARGFLDRERTGPVPLGFGGTQPLVG